MATSRINSSRRLCRKYLIFFYIAVGLLSLQLFLGYSFYSSNQTELQRLQEWKRLEENSYKSQLKNLSQFQDGSIGDSIKHKKHIGLELSPLHKQLAASKLEHSQKSQQKIFTNHDRTLTKKPRQIHNINKNPKFESKIQPPSKNHGDIIKRDAVGAVGGPVEDNKNTDFNDVLHEPKNRSVKHILCNMKSKETISAITRATSQQCKDEIADVACRQQMGLLYKKVLPRFCPTKDPDGGKHLGCFHDNREARDLKGVHTTFPNDNSPYKCINYCLAAGLRYAAVQFGTECWCGDQYGKYGNTDSSLCDASCPGDITSKCGGFKLQNVYNTGYGKKTTNDNWRVEGEDITDTHVRIAFVLTVNGRAVRQVKRLFKMLYHPHHYYFIHVDSRQDYLYRELSVLADRFPNVMMSQTRLSTIWGGASLLQMLIQCMRDMLAIKDWKWDYFVNLSESDFPIKPLNELTAFLTKFRGMNFVKSHGRDTPRFIKKQGLDKTFVQCDNHMWRLDSRKLPDGIRVDGGSDWVGLHRDFCEYVTTSQDDLVVGTMEIWKYTLLPAESFFHTVLHNSKFCTKVINNNLHLTNWRRKQGCKCQYKHIVDWCGCSPNDIKYSDWDKIKSTEDRPIYFARKFEAIIEQKTLNIIDEKINGEYPFGTTGLISYWQNDFHHLDHVVKFNNAYYTLYQAFIRQSMASLARGSTGCYLTEPRLLEVTTYHRADRFQGILVLYKAKNKADNKEVTIESHLKVDHFMRVFQVLGPSARMVNIEVGTDFDLKEEVFRNVAGLMGPFSAVSVRIQWGRGAKFTFTLMWIDPANTIAASYDISVNAEDSITYHKPTLIQPLRPGVWKVRVIYAWETLVESDFLIIPLTHYNNHTITKEEVQKLHNGPKKLYSDRDFADFREAIKLKNTKELQDEAEMNGRKTGESLVSWVNQLTEKFWKIHEHCVIEKASKCVDLDICYSTPWSSRSPDPKSEIGQFNLKTGRLR